ncbi:MAG: hypothetical protein GAK31_01723 [Stenotrophomonas maltophilia]|uniref:Uncharacterized protein n=1 Tax=Stenotrophomonas maltophilia TaxID=40324 RepID=A0A7V8FI92_STEMA|nr:MAG: hypothetical protein GAK31_01723 [Stenotrophomonas maltophilia]
MTQREISHPEGLPACAAGHSARHIHDQRRASAGDGHFIQCSCSCSCRWPDADSAVADWRRQHRPVRSARKAAPALPDNVLQLPLLAQPREIRRAGA